MPRPSDGEMTMFFRRVRHFKLAGLVLLAIAVNTLAHGQGTPAATTSNSGSGLTLTFNAPDSSVTDAIIAPNVWLYVPEGASPTPFLRAGRFAALWDGVLTAEKQGDFSFEVELNGRLKLEINGQGVLEADTNGVAKTAKPAQLNQGANAFKVHFNSPVHGDAFARLRWQPNGSFFQPIPLNSLSHSEGPDAVRSTALHLGRELFLEYRCAKCHAPAAASAAPELAMDAPSFEGIGLRRHYEWMSRWIQDPNALRASAHMPKLLSGPDAKQNSEAIAAFLASQKSADTSGGGLSGSADSLAASGKGLFETVHCSACHTPPDADGAEPAKIQLKRVREKFVAGDLVPFLQQPDQHYAWIRMPNFKLGSDEAAQLAAYLLAGNSSAQTKTAAPTDAATVDRGRKLVQTTGCLNCHALKLENQFTARSLADLPAGKWNQGCLGAVDGASDSADHNQKAPQFAFKPEERAALQAFGVTDRASLTRHVLAEFADRQTRLLNCRECHGKIENVPTFEILGGKLKPEWSAAFIAGANTNRLRPWLEARMPAFHNHAEEIAQGLAMLNGWPPRTPPEPPIDMDAAKVGQKLVSAAGGLNCVTCHAVGRVPSQIFETAGINFALSSSRLLKPYAVRWMRYPQLIDPATKMPLYWDDDGKSPLTDIYGGDGARQIDAIWEYLRLGDKIPPPPTP
jgi:mono/diheme cytochrome c family protein